jgi:hypothetical protein
MKDIINQALNQWCQENDIQRSDIISIVPLRSEPDLNMWSFRFKHPGGTTGLKVIQLEDELKLIQLK